MGPLKLFYFVNLKRTTPFLTQQRDFEQPRFYKKIVFAELSHNVSHPTLEVECCGAIELKLKGT